LGWIWAGQRHDNLPLGNIRNERVYPGRAMLTSNHGGKSDGSQAAAFEQRLETSPGSANAPSRNFPPNADGDRAARASPLRGPAAGTAKSRASSRATTAVRPVGAGVWSLSAVTVRLVLETGSTSRPPGREGALAMPGRASKPFDRPRMKKCRVPWPPEPGRNGGGCAQARPNPP